MRAAHVEIPKDAYPDGEVVDPKPDSVMKEFVSQRADLMRWSYGGTPADLDMIRTALGVERVVFSIIVERSALAADPRYESHFVEAKTPLVRYLRDAMLTGIRPRDNDALLLWPKYTLEFLKEAGFDGFVIKNAIRQFDMDVELQAIFNDEARKLGLPLIFDIG